MAFFGVSTNLINCGAPSASQKSESSDMTPYQAVLVAREVRMRGIFAAQQSYAQLQYEYGQAYAAYQQLQADVSAKAAAVEAFFQGEEAAARAVCESAAQAKVLQMQEGGTDYTHPKYASLIAGLRATHRRAVDELLVPYYTVANEMETAENALWVKHASLTAVQQIYNLWTIELNAADCQLQTMPADQDKSSDRNAAELRHLAQRVAEIRKKRLLRRKKEKTVARHFGGGEPSAGRTRSPQNPRQGLTVPDAGMRATSAPPRASSPSARSDTASKDSRTSKRQQFNASDWL